MKQFRLSSFIYRGRLVYSILFFSSKLENGTLILFHLLISFQLLTKRSFAVLNTFVISPFEKVVYCSKEQTVLDTFVVIRLALLPIGKVHFDTRSAPDPRSFLKCWSNLGTIYILRKDIGVGRWFRKWQFLLALCTENALM